MQKPLDFKPRGFFYKTINPNTGSQKSLDETPAHSKEGQRVENTTEQDKISNRSNRTSRQNRPTANFSA